jgi:ribosomal protein L29
MSFKPKQPELAPLDVLVYDLNNDDTDVKNLSQEQLAAYRLNLLAIKKAVGAKMAETSTKEHIYDIEEVTEYIDAILEDGYNLQSTELSDEPQFVDAQRLTRWADLIAERVEASMFGAKQFKIHSLRLLRSKIAKAKTLHDLRQAVTVMIDPLQLWRDHCVLVQKTSRRQVAIDNKETDQYIDDLLLEIEAKDKLLAERKRVIDEICSVYSEGDSDIELLRNIESAKKEHNLSDTQAAKAFGISRTKLTALRESIDLNASPADNDAVVVQKVKHG